MSPENSTGLVKCPKCSGSGQLTCSACRGSGKLACEKCGGKGRVLLPSVGAGQYADRNAYGGTIREEQCLACSATGFTGNCPTCNGYRVLRCDLCDGTGAAAQNRVANYIKERDSRYTTMGIIIVVAVIGLVALSTIFEDSGNSRVSPRATQPEPPSQPISESPSQPVKAEQVAPPVDQQVKPLDALPKPKPTPPKAEPKPAPKPAVDWKARYDQLYASYSSKFKAPSSGQAVELHLLSGGTIKGVVVSSDNLKIKIGLPSGSFVEFPKEQLARETRVQFFRHNYATFYTYQQIETEKKHR